MIKQLSSVFSALALVAVLGACKKEESAPPPAQEAPATETAPAEGTTPPPAESAPAEGTGH